jgi:KDO2-lipid IV(A) lauroyltransferase
MNPFLSALIWLPVNALGLLVTCFPRAFELWLGARLGRLALLVDRKRTVIARENIRRCLPELGVEGQEELLRKNFEHYGILMLELAHMFSPIEGHYARYVGRNGVVENFEPWLAADAKGGSIVVTGHFANWEMMAVAALRGVRVMITGKRLKPEWLNTRIVNARLSCNVRTASGRRILPELLRWIKDGNTSGFILDQYAAPPAGLPARFFGATVDTQGVVGLVAQRTSAPIFMVYQRRDETGVIHAIFEEVPLTEEELKDPALVTQKLASKVEGFIRSNPAQWTWGHRRFKNAVWPAASVTP